MIFYCESSVCGSTVVQLASHCQCGMANIVWSHIMLHACTHSYDYSISCQAIDSDLMTNLHVAHPQLFMTICCIIIYYNHQCKQLVHANAFQCMIVLRYFFSLSVCHNYYYPCRKFFMEKYGLTLSEANIVNSLVYIIPAATSPFIGYLIDKSGYNLIWC